MFSIICSNDVSTEKNYWSFQNMFLKTVKMVKTFNHAFKD